jgi:hypothetical protein
MAHSPASTKLWVQTPVVLHFHTQRPVSEHSGCSWRPSLYLMNSLIPNLYFLVDAIRRRKIIKKELMLLCLIWCRCPVLWHIKWLWRANTLGNIIRLLLARTTNANFLEYLFGFLPNLSSGCISQGFHKTLLKIEQGLKN